jgi:cytosine/adenosine deaminase-related metal-dependent hydrolase
MDAAADLGCKVRLHMAQGEMEVQTVRRLHGTTAPDWLAQAGLLSDRLIAPHATNATETDLAHYAAHGVSVVHCPLVSARFGSALRSFGRLKAAGINLCMGTDTVPADMLMNLMAGLLAARLADPGAPHQSSADFWDAATLGGARALNRDDLGRLAPGACADMAVFRLDDAVMTPAIDPITTLVAGGTGRVTQATFVDGRLSMCEGRVAGIDLAAAQSRAQAQFDGLVAKYPERSWQHPPVSDLFPPSYPIREEAIP